MCVPQVLGGGTLAGQASACSEGAWLGPKGLGVAPTAHSLEVSRLWGDTPHLEGRDDPGCHPSLAHGLARSLPSWIPDTPASRAGAWDAPGGALRPARTGPSA